ncbi:LuxR C-terminal-related transcriptional regulator [Streptomyces sp. NPDC056244]|uniref:LuxR C-terminal-related transcriptional regulator n=1 Tax=Streptomyces sp. NPDC056244 TaxID=3345762 RepID=UPI0035DF5E65
MLDLYTRIAKGETIPPDQPGLDELLELGLVVRHIFVPDLYLLTERQHAWKTLTEREGAAIAQSATRLRALSVLFDRLPGVQGSEEGGIEFLPTPVHATAAVSAAIADVRHHVYTAQPKEREELALRQAVDNDIERLDRGIELRTIYPDSARSRAPETRWASTVTAHGAEVRTLASRFQRMIIIDEALAIVSDHKSVPANTQTGWKVTHPGMIGVITESFELQWDRAEPWMGGRTRRRSGTVTTPRVRAILRGLSAGQTLRTIANNLDISSRTISTSLAPVYEALDIEPGDYFRLAEWWATTDERTLD